MNSDILTDDEKQIIISKSKYVSKELILKIWCEKHRTQLQNKKDALEKFRTHLRSLFVAKKKRKPSKPSKASKLKRLEGKRKASEKKQLRKRII